MGEKRKTADAPTDRLEQLVVAKEVTIEIEGRSLRIIKWNLKQTLRLSVVLGKIVRDIAISIPSKQISDAGKEDRSVGEMLSAVLAADLPEIAESQHDSIVQLVAETIVRGNFGTLAEAREYVEGLGAEVFEIIGVIGRQNIRPLVKAVAAVLGDVASLVRQKAPVE